MRLLLALLVVLLPTLPGSAGAASRPGVGTDGAPSIGALHDLLDEHARGAASVGANGEAAPAASEGSPRAPSHSVPVPRLVPCEGGRTIARGSDLELGARSAARGEHSPYFPTAPPRTR